VQLGSKPTVEEPSGAVRGMHNWKARGIDSLPVCCWTLTSSMPCGTARRLHQGTLQGILNTSFVSRRSASEGRCQQPQRLLRGPRHRPRRAEHVQAWSIHRRHPVSQAGPTVPPYMWLVHLQKAYDSVD
ncbi:unnamed protein product, partial [Ectocarpus sp. 12 AP-2014]